MKEDNFNDNDRNNPYTLSDDSAEPDFSSIDDDNIEGSVTGGSEEAWSSTPIDEQAQPEAGDGQAIAGDAQSDDDSVQEPKDRSVDGGSEKERNDIGSDIIRGHINTIILRALYERDKYGYEIMSDIERKSHGQYSLKQPTLYSALKRLENQGYIRAYWKTDEVSNGGRRKYFTLTESGREITEKNLAEWEYSRTIIDSLISDRAFDFSQPAPTPVDFTILRNSVSRVPVVRSDEEGRSEHAEGEEAHAVAAHDDSAGASTSASNSGTNEPAIQTQQPANEQANAQSEQSEQNVVQPTVAGSEQPQASTEVVTTDNVVQQSTETQQTAEQSIQQDSQTTVAAQEQAIQQTASQDAQSVAQQSVNQPATSTPQQATTQAETAVASATPTEAQLQEQAQAEARRIAHENYLRLISEPVRVQPTPQEDVVPGSERVNTDSLIYNNRPETERDYKNLIDGIFRRAVSNGSVQYTRVEQPKPKQEVQHVRLVDRGRADGVKVATSSTSDSSSTYASKTTYDKGKTFLKASAVVLAITLIEFVLCFVFLNQLNTTWVYPAVILGIGVVQFAIFGIMALQGYGKNSVRPTTSGYISSCIILSVIGILIISAISFLLDLNPTSAVDIIKKIVIPSITVLNLVVFAVCFKAFIK